MPPDLRNVPATLIFFEAGQRLSESLRDMNAIFGNRSAAICRELTKLHEEIRRGSLKTLLSEYPAGMVPKGELTIVIGAPPEAAPDLSKADMLLAKALPYMPVNAAAELVAIACDLPKRAAYARALALKNND